MKIPGEHRCRLELRVNRKVREVIKHQTLSFCELVRGVVRVLDLGVTGGHQEHQVWSLDLTSCGVARP